MGIINVLDISVANLIAAGEVVERPSSAVKELIENSIDAGAGNITVEIKNGGISLLRVTDDGCGMSAEDAVMSIKRHATSKIKTANDLTAIMTLGFRGEALAAISAVTKFRILTKRRSDSVGCALVSNYGSAPKVEEVGCPDGTTVLCEELFATTPARLKFLKSDSAEATAVQSVVERAAVSHPEIAFKFISDGAIKFSTVGDNNAEGAIYSVFGRAFANSLTRVQSQGKSITVDGFVCSPVYARGNRGMQIFFVNGRNVRSKLLTAALEQAFQTYIPIGKFPSCVLNVKIHGAYVDVNIHPSKLEVKFSDEREVFSAVYYAVRSALEGGVKRPSIDENPVEIKPEKTINELKITSAFAPIRERGEKDAQQLNISEAVPSFSPAAEKPKNRTESSAFPEWAQRSMGMEKHPEISIDVTEPRKEAAVRSGVGFDNADGNSIRRDIFTVKNTDADIPDRTANPVPEYRIVGEAFETYVIIELVDKIMLIDKHAAHERINFEILRAQMKNLTPNVQLLLAPETIHLTSEESEAVSVFANEIESVGFVFELSSGVVKISGVPIGYDVKTGCDLFLQMVGSLIDEGVPLEIKKRSVFEHALYQTSCKMSIKAGRHYSDEYVRWVCDNVLRYDCIKFCPHGRPVAFEMTKRELDARFGRIK